jgi:hypothetical protein
MAFIPDNQAFDETDGADDFQKEENDLISCQFNIADFKIRNLQCPNLYQN